MTTPHILCAIAVACAMMTCNPRISWAADLVVTKAILSESSRQLTLTGKIKEGDAGTFSLKGTEAENEAVYEEMLVSPGTIDVELGDFTAEGKPQIVTLRTSEAEVDVTVVLDIKIESALSYKLAKKGDGDWRISQTIHLRNPIASKWSEATVILDDDVQAERQIGIAAKAVWVRFESISDYQVSVEKIDELLLKVGDVHAQFGLNLRNDKAPENRRKTLHPGEVIIHETTRRPMAANPLAEPLPFADKNAESRLFRYGKSSQVTAAWESEEPTPFEVGEFQQDGRQLQYKNWGTRKLTVESRSAKPIALLAYDDAGVKNMLGQTTPDVSLPAGEKREVVVLIAEGAEATLELLTINDESVEALASLSVGQVDESKVKQVSRLHKEYRDAEGEITTLEDQLAAEIEVLRVLRELGASADLRDVVQRRINGVLEDLEERKSAKAAAFSNLVDLLLASIAPDRVSGTSASKDTRRLTAAIE